MTLKVAIELAYEKGYRVTDDGSLISPYGPNLTIAIRGKQRYPTFSVNGVKDVPNKYGVFGIPVHRFAGYCFYGDEIFDTSKVLRHINGNVLDVSKKNLVLGSHSENNFDKSSSVRSSAAKKARAAQGYRAHNARFSDDEIRYIRNSDLPAKALAEWFGVSKVTIYDIRKRVKYADVT